MCKNVIIINYFKCVINLFFSIILSIISQALVEKTLRSAKCVLPMSKSQATSKEIQLGRNPMLKRKSKSNSREKPAIFASANNQNILAKKSVL